MEKHLSLLGILFLCYHAAALVAAVIVIITFMGIGLISATGLRHALDVIPWMPFSVMGIIGWMVSTILLITALPGFIAGIGLIRFRPWARILGIIVAFFNLFSFPVGTALAVYAFWVLFSDESSKLLNSSSD